MSSGYLCLDWVWGEDAETEFEPIAGLGYWESFVVIEALRPYLKERRAKLSYYEAKGEQNRGTEVLRDSIASCERTIDAFTIVLNKMRDAYREDKDEQGHPIK